eukprot:56379_1
MAFGLSKDQIPKTIEEFEEFYFYDMIESGHIVVTKDCARWCKVFFMCNNWYREPINYALKCYTSLLMPESVRDKFNKFDATLLPNDNFSYLYGISWLGLSRGVYMLFPTSFRYLNDYMRLKERIHGKNHYNVFEKLMKTLSGYAANHVVYSFLEG